MGPSRHPFQSISSGMTRKAWSFLGLTFALTWLIEGIALRWMGDFSTLNAVGSGLGLVMLVFIGSMYVPTLAVLIVQKGLYDGSLTSLGLSFRFNWWWVAAVLLPMGVAVASVGVSVLWPDVTLSSGKGFLLDQLEAGSFPPEQLNETKRSIEEGEAVLGPALAVLLFGATLVAGPTVNGLAAFGEEFGWRGFLQKELASLGFWPSSLLIGGIWGLWHAPLILGGYNYPGVPVRGMVMMVLFTVGWSPVLAYLVVHGRSVIPAAMAHGTINAVGGTTYVFLEGGSRLESGLLGIAGVVVLVVLNGGLWWHQHRWSKAFTERWEEFCPSPQVSS